MKRITACVLVFLLLLSACAQGNNPAPSETAAATAAATTAPPQTDAFTEAATEAPEEDILELVPLAYNAPFAVVTPYVYTGTPAIPAYSVAPGLSNVLNYAQFEKDGRDWETMYGYWHSDNELSDEAMRMIEKNGFAVSDKYSYAEFFQIYESNRYNAVPNFITSDSAVHTFHLMFDYVLTDLEQSKLHGILSRLNEGMATEAYGQYMALLGTGFENAALRNVAFFCVGGRLLDERFYVPPEAVGVVNAELALIAAQAGIADSPVVNLGNSGGDPYRVDYTQYITRSHYNQTPELQAYFKAMMWYGQITLRSSVADEVKSAILQTAMMTSEELSALWAGIFEPTNFFVGECDDITYYQYGMALNELYGGHFSLANVTDEALFEQAWAIVKAMPGPQINSVPILETEDVREATAGYRFMGQRFTLDAFIFQQLIDRLVPDRMLPRSLDIPAALGSDKALEILADDVAAYPEYSARMNMLREGIADIPEADWTGNLYWSWMHMLLPYTDGANGAGYPSFMQNDAWVLKELNSFQGSWTELKHDTLLYAKAAMAEMGGGDEEPEKPDDRGYVEPSPDIYGRLAALVKQTVDGLTQRGLLTDAAGEALGTLYTLAQTLTDIAERELANEALTDADYDFIRTYGGELEHIWDTAKHYELSRTTHYGSDEVYDEDFVSELTYAYLYQHPCGVVADVATDPNGVALEQATGFAKTIFVVFPRDGELVLGSGTVFSQYEFVVPMSERLTDETWHEMMNANLLPPMAPWKSQFFCDLGMTRYGQ